MSPLLFLLAASGEARAFCGNYVGEAGAELTNSASEVVLVRQGTRTTITMANDFAANVGQFAVVVPVPEVLTEDDVRVLDRGVFDTLDRYSGPRLVAYTCDELFPEVQRNGPSIGCAEYALSDQAANGAGPPSEVDVLSHFIVGEYEVVVLSAEQSGALLTWLNDNGYAVSAASQALFQEYLDAGSLFFAARVFLDRLPEQGSWLSPLQFGYDADVFALPIRPGTVNSPGSQDLVLYTITDVESGQVRISNYPEATAEDECLYAGAPEDFGAFYEDRFDEAVGGEAAWVMEYGWEVTPWVAACDPCPPTETAEPMPTEQLMALGFDPTPEVEGDTGAFSMGASYTFTRLRMRYRPDQVHEDLSLYASGIRENTQQRYVQHASYLEDLYPLCVEGWVADPGSCADEGAGMRRRMRHANQQANGCAARAERTWPAATLALVVLGLGLRRRRQAAG